VLVVAMDRTTGKTVDVEVVLVVFGTVVEVAIGTETTVVVVLQGWCSEEVGLTVVVVVEQGCAAAMVGIPTTRAKTVMVESRYFISGLF
jgi:hypothetical protein